MSRRASATVLGLLLVSLITGLSSIAGATGSNAGPATPRPAEQNGSNGGTVTPPTTPPTTTPPTTPPKPPASGSNTGSNSGGGPGEQGEPPAPTPDPTPAPSPGAGGGTDLGPAVAAPATADDAPAPAGPAAAGTAAAGPGAPPADDPGAADAVAVAPAPTDDALALPDFVVGTIDDTATPRTAAESLVARAPQSIAAVAALILAIIVFLAFHRRPDRHDPRLAAANGVQDVARFR